MSSNAGTTAIGLRVNVPLIRDMMKRLGIGGRELARRSNLHRNTVWELLNDKHNSTSLSTICAVAGGLNIHPLTIIESYYVSLSK